MTDDGASVQDASEMELLEGMIAGDRTAWRLFHERYDHLIYRCITRVTRKFSRIVSRDDVREITSSLMYNLLRRDMYRLRGFEPDKGNKLGSWIGLLAINTAYDYLRRMSRRPREVMLAEAAAAEGTMPDPYEALLDRERRDRMDAVMSAFSRRDQKFVQLYYREGRSPDEVARVMGISTKTVYSKKHKITNRFVDLLAETRSGLTAASEVCT